MNLKFTKEGETIPPGPSPVNAAIKAVTDAANSAIADLRPSPTAQGLKLRDINTLLEKKQS